MIGRFPSQNPLLEKSDYSELFLDTHETHKIASKAYYDWWVSNIGKDFNEFNALESDTENFVNFITSVEGVQLGMLFIELKKGFKVSFRSKGKIPVNKLAGVFGGGGHLNASGARFRDSEMRDMIPNILKEAEDFFNNYSKGKNV